jgi:hypothetical protein
MTQVYDAKTSQLIARIRTSVPSLVQAEQAAVLSQAAVQAPRL